MAKKSAKVSIKEAEATSPEDSGSSIDDPDNYMKMIVPHETPEAAEAAWLAFYKDVYESRKRHRIAEAVIAGELRFMHEGKRKGVHLTGSMGNEAAVVRLMAMAYGQVKQKFELLLNELSHPANGGE